MGARPGTNNNSSGGNSNSGRKSVYQERADVDALYKMFFGDMSKEEVQAKLKTGKYSLFDSFLAKGFSGNDKILTALFNRVFPANVNIGSQEGNPLVILSDEELNNNIRELQRVLGTALAGEVDEEREG